MMFRGRAGRSGIRAIGLATGLLAFNRPGAGDGLLGFHETFTPLDVHLEWRRGVFGPAIGEGGLRVVDLDRNGTMEIVAGPGGADRPSGRWWIASHRDGRPDLTWVSPWSDQGVTSLVVSNIDGDPAREVLVATNSQVRVYDGATRTVQGTIEVPGLFTRNLTVSDLDGDGRRELVLCADALNSSYPYPAGRAALYVYDALTGAQIHANTALLTVATYNGPVCSSLAVGNVDGDPAPEIVVANGSGVGYVFDSATRSVQWVNVDGFGRTVRIADLDRDGQSEVVSAAADYNSIRVFDAARHTLVRTVQTRVYAMEILDADGDGALELVHGSEDGLRVRSMPGLDEEWALPGQTEIGGIAAGDTDGDGTRELVFGGSGRLVIADSSTRGIVARSALLYGPFHGLAHGQLEGQGRHSLVYTALGGDNGGDYSSLQPRYFVQGTRGWRLRYASPPLAERGFFQDLMRARVANLDDDPALEVVVGAGERYSLGSVSISCHDGSTRALQWKVPLEAGSTLASLATGDVDGDGMPDVVIGGAAGGVQEGGWVMVLDGRSGALKWRSPTFGGYDAIVFLRLAQLDTDAALEIVAANQYPGSVFVLDGVVRDVLSLGDQDVTALDTPDRDGDGRAEVLVGTDWGDLRVIDPYTGALVERVGLFGARVDGLAVQDVNGDGAADYTFGLGGRVRILDGHTRATLWTSERLGLGVGRLDSLLVADVDGDEPLELVVNTGEDALDVYELRTPGLPRTRRRLR